MVDAIGSIGIGITIGISIVIRSRYRRAARLRSTFSEPDSHAPGPCSSGRSWQSPPNRKFSRQEIGGFASMHARKGGLCLCLFWSHRRCDPVPALLATHRGYTKLDFVGVMSLIRRQSNQSRLHSSMSMCSLPHCHFLTANWRDAEKQRPPRRDTVRRWLPNGPTTGSNYFRSLADRSVR